MADGAPFPRFLVRVLPDGIWQILPEWVEPSMLVVADYEVVEIERRDSGG